MDHIPKFALVAKPLYDIMGPSATLRWGTEQEKAFDELRLCVDAMKERRNPVSRVFDRPRWKVDSDDWRVR